MKRRCARVLAVLFSGLLCLCIQAAALAKTQTGVPQANTTTAGELKLVNIAVSDITQNSAKVVFRFDKDVGANQLTNKTRFYARNAWGGDAFYTLEFWTRDTDTRRNEVEMKLFGLSANSIFTVGVEAGVLSNDNTALLLGSSRNFTTLAVSATPLPVPTAAPTIQVPTPQPTQAPIRTAHPIYTPIATQQTPVYTAAPAISIPITSSLPLASGAMATPSPLWYTPGTLGMTPMPTSSGYGAWVQGNPFATPLPSGDTAQLVFVGCNPADGSTDVQAYTSFTLEFSDNVVSLGVRDVNRNAVTMWKDDEQQIDIDIAMADDQVNFEERAKIVVTPQSALESKSKYTLRVDGSLTAKTGAALGQTVELHFYTTGYNAFPLWAIGAIGAGGAMLIASGVAVVVLRRKRFQEEDKAADESVPLLPSGTAPLMQGDPQSANHASV